MSQIRIAQKICKHTRDIYREIIAQLFPPSKEGGYVFAIVYLSVRLSTNSLGQKVLHGFNFTVEAL